MSALGGIASIVQSVVNVGTTAIGSQSDYKQGISGQEQAKVDYSRSKDLYSYSSYSFGVQMVALVIAAAFIGLIVIVVSRKKAQ